MGQNQASFSNLELQEYEDLTFLTRQQILRAHRNFSKFDPARINRNRNAKVATDQIKNKIPQLKFNPFGDRICNVFSTAKDNYLTFEDYLEMISVFSNKSTLTVKTAYAFRIYDFDSDGVLGHSDLREVVNRMVGTTERHLTNSDVCKVIDNILKEVDIDEDGSISFSEFDQAITKCPEFLLTFTMMLV